MHDAGEVLALVGVIELHVDPVSLTTVLTSPAGAALLGHPAQVALPRDAFWDVLVPGEDHPRMLRLLREVAADGVARTLEHRAHIPGRTVVWLRTAVAPLPGEGPGAPRLRAVMLDVSAAKASERHSDEVESWLAALGESLPFDFWISDRLGRVVLQNPASRRRLGNLAGQIVTAPEEPGSGAAPLYPPLARALAGERVREELTVPVDGEERTYARILNPLHPGSGDEPSGALAVDIDVTELKRVEQRLRSSLEQLRQAQGELVRRERLAVLGEMAAAVAHEVRNPLGAMFNVIELLRRRPSRSADEAELIGILSEELTRIDVLVTNLFDLVRPLEAVLRPQSLVQVADEALAEALRASSQAARIRVQRRVEQEPLEVSMDGALLGLALINLLRNALQAMPDGGELGLELGRDDRDGLPWARIAIRDSGPGISPEVRPRIFEPFFTTRPTGSGLGLAIVKRVVAEHRGELEVQTGQGEGTAFVLRLPCARPEVHPG